MSDFFKTLSSPAEGIYKDKMSKFLSFAHPVETAEEAKEIIKSECYIFNPLDFDKSTKINTALDMAIEALEKQDRIAQILDDCDLLETWETLDDYDLLEAWEILEMIKEEMKE